MPPLGSHIYAKGTGWSVTGSDPQHHGLYRSRVQENLQRHASSEQSSGLSLTVLFTNSTGTLKALQGASHLAHQLGARIQILIAYVVPYPLPIDKARVDPEYRLRQFITACKNQPIEIRIDIWLCRDVRQCLHDALPSNSLVVVGGRRSWWPLTYEKRLTRIAKNAGHQAIFIASQEPH